MAFPGKNRVWPAVVPLWATPSAMDFVLPLQFEEEDLIRALASHPGLLKAPIAIRGDRAVICSSPTDIYKLSKEEKYTIY